MLKKLPKFLLKHWFIVHLFFLVLYVAYICYKIFADKGVNPLDGKEEIIAAFNLPLFLLLLTGFILLSGGVFLKKINFTTRIVLLSAGYILASFGFIKTLDPELDWQGGDVAWGNYNAANEINQYGIQYVVNTWNDRTNPSLQSPFQEVNDSVLSIFNNYNLHCLTFNKWKHDIFPGGLEKSNNRPYMHPPFAPIFLGFWLKIIPFGRWSAVLLMILISLVSLLFFIFFFFRNEIFHYEADKILVLALFTTPVMIIFPNPSAEQLSGLLFLLSVVLIIKSTKRIKISYFIAGVLIGLAFYTKFNIIFYIFIQLVFLAVKMRYFGFKAFAAYASGIFMVFLFFTLSGYYFWLTFITGFVYTKIYAINNPVGLLLGFSKLIYFGPALFLLFFIFIADKQMVLSKNNPVLLPVLLSLVVLSLFLWDQGTWNRYLTFYLPAMSLFLLPALRKHSFKTRDLIIIPVVNITFLFLSIYL